MKMNVGEIKNELHKFIVETDDAFILMQVQSYFNDLKSGANGQNNLSKKEIKLIEKGLKDIEAGRVVPHSKVRERIRKTIEKHKDTEG